MKIILTTVSPNIDSAVDSRFGRGAYFTVVDTDTLGWQAHPNPGGGASGGAGIEAAQFVVEHGAEAVISGDFGPNAVKALQACGIEMYGYGTCQTAQEAIAQFKAGQLRRISTATRSEGDHGHRQ